MRGRDSNPRPLDRESDALPQHHDATTPRHSILCDSTRWHTFLLWSSNVEEIWLHRIRHMPVWMWKINISSSHKDLIAWSVDGIDFDIATRALYRVLAIVSIHLTIRRRGCAWNVYTYQTRSSLFRPLSQSDFARLSYERHVFDLSSEGHCICCWLYVNRSKTSASLTSSWSMWTLLCRSGSVLWPLSVSFVINTYFLLRVL